VGTPWRCTTTSTLKREGDSDEGPAGPRGEGFYAGYFRDLDGNKLDVYRYG
jgi:hypothetical protein